MNLFILLIVFFSPLVALSAGGAPHSNEIPSVIIWQVANLTILFGAIIYYTKDKVISLFIERRAAYLASAEKSQRARAEAEKILVDISEKLRTLRSTADESMARAEAESVEMRNRLISESKQISQRIKKEAEVTVQAETEKAILELRNLAAREAIESARQVLSKDIGANDHQLLQEQFSKKVAAVQP